MSTIIATTDGDGVVTAEKSSVRAGGSFLHVSHRGGVWLTADETRAVIAALTATLPAEAPVETTKAVDLGDVLVELQEIKAVILSASEKPRVVFNAGGVITRPRPIGVGDVVEGERVYFPGRTVRGEVTEFRKAGAVNEGLVARFRILTDDGARYYIHAGSARRA